MDDKIEEEFNSTEIKIEEVEFDLSEDLELLSKFKADAYSVSCISVPKMREFVKENDSISYATSIESDRHDEQGIFSQHHQESERERKDEHKQEQSPPYEHYEENGKLGREINSTKLSQPFQYDQKDENKRVLKNSEESLQDKLFQYRQLKERLEKLQRVQDESRQKKFQYMKEVERIKRQVDKNMQVIFQLEKIIDRVMQIISQRRQNDRFRRELDEAMQVASQTKQEIEMFRREMEETIQRNAFSSLSARCSKPQIHDVEGKSLTKSKENKGQVLDHEFNETFQQFCKVNVLVSDKVVSEASKDETVEKEKDLMTKINMEINILTKKEN